MVKKEVNITRRTSLQRLGVALLLLLGLNFLLSKYYLRFDLTKEKRYTLTKSTVSLIKNLKDPVYVEVYLEGKDLPAGIKKLRNSTKDMLEEFKARSNGKVEYHFFNIDKIKDNSKKEKFQEELIKKGILPTNVQVKKEGGFQEKLVFPGALIRIGSRELPIQILENQLQSGQNSLDNSVNFLEYKIANTINKLSQDHRPRVAFVTDKGGPQFMQLADFVDGLRLQNFQVQKIDISAENLHQQGLDILVIAKPTQPFSEQDKFKIDQFVMNGGKVLWMIDPIIADLDSFKNNASIMSIPRELNLTDILFRYGIRTNSSLLLDLYCNQIPLVQEVGGNPQTQFFPWVFYPVILSQNNHPIVKNLDPVTLEFASGLDTIRSPGVQKTILLQSSIYSRLQNTPFEIYLEGASIEPQKELFNRSNIPVGVLMEGSFKSLYKNHLTEDLKTVIASEQLRDIKGSSKPTKMIVIADGDICENDVDQNGNYLPLGYYKYTKETFANKTFLLNCVEYLIDDIGLIEARNRENKMQLLDKAKVNDSRALWQIVNVVLPIVGVVIFGLIFNQRRKRRYAR